MKAGDTAILSGVGSLEVVKIEEVRGRSVIIRGKSGQRRAVAANRLRVDIPAPEPKALTSAPNYERPKPSPAAFKDPPTRSKPYLDFVRAKSCTACHAPAPSDPHHWALKGRGSGGMGQKVDDHRVVPLCRSCHDHFHAHGALPETTVITTRILFLAKQTDLLVEWIKKGEK